MSSERKLESVFLFTTGKCNAKCAMCFYANDMEQKAPDLSFDNIKKLSETAGDFKRLWLSGGEPTLREELPEIIEMFYKNNHITDVNMPSNGMKPERVVEWLKRIRQSCPDLNISISISFDGFGTTHDTQRGVASFYKAAETLKLLDDNFRDDGHVIKGCATVITKYNVEEVQDFVAWVYGRFNLTTHTIEAARGMTREDGVKVLNEGSLRAIQDDVAPYYTLYAKRVGDGMTGIARIISKYFYVGLMRTMYNIRATNLDKPTPWGMDCTAGETTLVIDYDGRFRACELRPPLGKVQDYNCNVQDIMNGPAMKKEIADIGHGYKANCWCTHGCWIMSSLNFNPGKMVSKIIKSNGEVKKLKKFVQVDEAALRALEAKYHLDTDKLAEIGLIPGAQKAGAA
ncbi:hypothetical protein FACS189450_08670 [Spirochaetia bacterium]|nr:hypothetical protein FACS189450_08670 [Spirochaetia bacterium]GHU93874.1 hypothetical protein FACS189479_05870 [Spirochaetia bacterium]